MNGAAITQPYEFFKLTHSCDRVGEKPLFPVIRVCFWRVHVSVQGTRIKKTYEVVAFSERVRFAVKPFDNTEEFIACVQVPRGDTANPPGYQKVERVLVLGLC